MKKELFKIIKKKMIKKILVFFVIFNLAFYPLLPVLAEETGGILENSETPVISQENISIESNTSEEEAKNEGEGEEVQNENSNPAEILAEAPVCQWEDLEREAGEEKTQECRKLATCGEIENCLTAKIEIENKTEIENNTLSLSDTGANEIVSTEASFLSTDREVAPEEENQEKENEENTPENQDDEEDQSEEENNSIAKEEKNEEVDLKIETGEALSASNVVNEINTNIIGENGVKQVENIYGNYAGDINLLETFSSVLDGAKKISAENQSVFDSLEISIKNSADVKNEVETVATTGENEISAGGDAEKEAQISTGDAVASSEVVNMVNTNIIGNNWLFAVINVFGNWVGDLIVPGEGLLLAQPEGAPSNIEIEIENETAIANNLETSASTGENKIENENGSSVISTGEAVAQNIVENQIGATIIKNNWFFLLVNNMGNWVGSVSGWNEEKKDYETSFSFDLEEAPSAGEATFDGNDFVGWFSKIFIKNSANIENEVKTFANTGGNEIENENGEAQISTGNAVALSRVYNLVNNNFIGNNWMFAVLNIFGSWEGDLEFAYPDLAVEMKSDTEKVKKGDIFSYRINYKNQGRADSKKVKLQASLPDFLKIEKADSGMDFQANGNELVWELDKLGAEEEKSFSLSVKIADDLPEGVEFLESQIEISALTEEVAKENNRSSDKIEIYQENLARDDSQKEKEEENQLTISREILNEYVEVGSSARHIISVKNDSDETIREVVISDKVKNANGSAGEYIWFVPEIPAGKKAVLNYELLIRVGAPTGEYKNTALVSGLTENGKEIKSEKSKISFSVWGGAFSAPISGEYSTALGEEKLEVAPFEEAGEVLGTMKKSNESFLIWFWFLATGAYYWISRSQSKIPSKL